MHSGARGVERELADRDAHAVRAEIAEPEDALAVGDDDDRGLLYGQLRSTCGMRPRSAALT